MFRVEISTQHQERWRMKIGNLKIVNLTGALLRVFRNDGDEEGVDLPSEGCAVRKRRPLRGMKEVEVAGFTVICTAVDSGDVRGGTIEGLPAPARGTFYVVNPLVAEVGATFMDRRDLLIPGPNRTDPRDKGVACMGFVHIGNAELLTHTAEHFTYIDK